MNKGTGIRTIAMLCLGLSVTSAQAADVAARQCVTPEEASGLILALAPDALKAVGKACEATLPATALLRQTDGPFLRKYQAEVERAGPLADAAVMKMVGGRDKKAAAVLGGGGVRAMMSAMLMPKLAAGIKPRDCLLIERIASALEPLPPQNMTDLVVTILQASNADRARKGGKADIDICPAGVS